MRLQPRLSFESRCKEAIAFYQTAAGAQVDMPLRFKDPPDPSMGTIKTRDKVMHAALRIGETTIMASDGHCSGHAGFGGFSPSLALCRTAAAGWVYAPWPRADRRACRRSRRSCSFGMLTDTFGVVSMITAATENQPAGNGQTV